MENITILFYRFVAEKRRFKMSISTCTASTVVINSVRYLLDVKRFTIGTILFIFTTECVARDVTG